VVVLDDVITTGASKLEAIRPLQEAGLQVRDVVVLIDREQGGRQMLEAEGYRVHAVLGLRRILASLERQGRITSAERPWSSAACVCPRLLSWRQVSWAPVLRFWSGWHAVGRVQ
jgi:orotate phosphoribosyltransferase